MQIVFFNMSNLRDWRDGTVNRNFFLVEELMRREEVEKVLLVDFLAWQLPFTLFGKKRNLSYAFGEAFSGGGERIDWTHKRSRPNELPFVDVNTEAHHLSGAGIIRSNEAMLQIVESAMKKAGFTKRDTLIWSYNPFIPRCLDLPARLSVFDAVDNWAEHEAYDEQQSVLLKRHYEIIGKKADQIFTVSETLRKLFANEATKWIANGVDTRRIFPGKRERAGRPVVGYVGTIEKRFDFTLMHRICREHSEKRFKFYGRVWKSVEADAVKLERACNNVSFEGRIPYDKLPQALQNMDLAILPHKQSEFSASMNPMKLYEYLAAGKPVVTTMGTGLEDVDAELMLTRDEDKFSAGIDKLLEQDTASKREKRRQAVIPHSWKSRVDEMLAHVRKAW